MSSPSSADSRPIRRCTPRILVMTASLLASILAVPWLAGIGGGTGQVGAIGATPNPYVERVLLPNPTNQQRPSKATALSSDGSTAVVAYATVAAVAVFGVAGNTYRLIGPALTDPAGSQAAAFGRSVAVTSDGATVVIGDPGNPSLLYAYTRAGNTYVEQGGAPIASGGTDYSLLGDQVAVSGDGTTVVATARTTTPASLPVVLVYTKAGGVYSRTQVLAGGAALAISTDGTTLAIGATGGPPGNVSVYVRSGGTYAPFGGPLSASDGTNNNAFGALLAVSGDGATLAIGAHNSTAHPQQAVVYIFTKGASAYTQGQEFLVGAVTNTSFDGGIALNGDGAILALGLTYDLAAEQAALLPPINIYRRSGATYSLFDNGLIPFESGVFPSFLGGRLALSGDGGTLLSSRSGDLTPAIFTTAPIAGVGVWRSNSWNMDNALTTIPDADFAFTFSYSSPDVPLLCDWIGTDTKQPGVFISGGWAVGQYVKFTFGQAGDIPLCGDWTGQGKQTVGVFRSGTFYLRNSNTSGNTADIVVAFGQAGDIPVVGDWTGQGKQTVGVYRNGVFYLLNNNASSATADIVVGFGQAGDVPVVGDWTGGGIESIGVFRNGAWYLRNTNTPGAADIFFLFGTTGDVPLVRSERANGVSGPGIQPRIAPTATAVKGTATVPRNAATATPGKGTATPNPLPPSRP